MASPRDRREAAAWWALCVLLALTVGRAATAPRDRWPGLVGDEPTYLMQAESLAWDGDLRFAAGDLTRYRERHGHSPEVILQSGDGGGRIVYGKPFPYAVAIAPLVRLLGERGALLTNALALSAAALLAALALVRSGHPWGPLWIATTIFASLAFGHTYWIHPDLFLMAATGCGLALAHLLCAPAAGAGWGRLLGWALSGALLAVPGAWRPPYLLVMVPGAFLALVGAGGASGAARGRVRDAVAGDRDDGHGGHRLTAFAIGAVAVAALSIGGQKLASGSWSPYAGERRGFSSLEGFPGVDFPAEEWSRRVQSKGNTSWLEQGAVETLASPTLARFDLTYLFVGRTVGLLPYFLPALLAPFRRRTGAAARLELAMGIAVPLAFVVLRPFNFYGGAGALANRYFLPAYPLFWFGGAGLGRSALAALLAAPFVLPSWLAPADYPLVPGEGYRYVSPVAHRLLPVETTQRHVKAPGRPDVIHGALWVRFLDGGLTVGAGDRLDLAPGRSAEILVGSPRPLAALVVETLDGGSGEITVRGPGTTAPGPRPGVVVLELSRPTARHPMWWTDAPFCLYRVVIESVGTSAAPVPLRLKPG